MKARHIFRFALIALIAGLMGCHHNKSPEDKAEWITDKIDSKLDLSDQQRQKLDDLAQTVLEQFKVQKEKREANQGKVKDLLLSDKIEPTEIVTMVNQHREGLNQVLPEVAEKASVFHASLTLDQKNKLVKMMDKFHNGRRGCRH